MNGYSQTPKEERIEKLKAIMPEIFDDGKIDWEKLRAVLGDDVDIADERYRLNWAGKSDAFRVMQEASAATLVPCREESVDFDNTQNIFIEGENMEVLKVLQKSYFGKVKMIYIDPPYNTGSDSFIYPDRFAESREEYMRRVGDKDDEGYMLRDGMFRKNSKENGQYHSNWLNMMMPRLYLAKSLLREDGIIFVSIDDNEVHNMRLLMNEIFGEDNFLAEFPRVSKRGGKSTDTYAKNHDYVLGYGKNLQTTRINGIPHSDTGFKYRDEYFAERGAYKLNQTLDYNTLQYNPTMDYVLEIDGKSYVPGGNFTLHEQRHNGIHGKHDWVWRWSKRLFDFGYANGWIEISKTGRIYTKTYLNAYIEKGEDNEYRIVYSDRTKPITTLDFTDNIYSNDNSNKEITALMGSALFDYVKPTALIKMLAATCYGKDDLIMDFFAGSGTTAHAVMSMNRDDGGSRKYICVQLSEPCDVNSEAGKSGYRTIADIAKERIRRAGAKIRTEIEAEQEKKKGQLEFDDAQQTKMPDLGFKVFKLADSNFKQWRKIRGSETEAWKQQVLEFIDPVAENATVDNMVYELLLKSGKDLNSTIEHKGDYYVVNDGELVLMLESATQETVDAVLAASPKKVIALDRLFEGNDQLKTNTVLQMKDAGITFITI